MSCAQLYDEAAAPILGGMPEWMFPKQIRARQRVTAQFLEYVKAGGIAEAGYPVRNGFACLEAAGVEMEGQAELLFGHVRRPIANSQLSD